MRTTHGAAFAFNLRFPGQYYDVEAGLSHNYYRDYDSRIGRYLESDPIGLLAGPNTYGYAGGDPLTDSDPFGLDAFACYKPLHGLGSFGRLVYSPTQNPLFQQYLCVIIDGARRIYFGYTLSRPQQVTIQQVLKWGNSLALRIPSAIAKQMRVSAGAKVEIRLEGSRLVIEPTSEDLPRFTRSDLLRALKRAKTREDRLGRPRGREIL